MEEPSTPYLIFSMPSLLSTPFGSFYFVIELAAETKVYTLSNLGLKLKDTLINGSDILFTEDDL